MHTCVSGLGPYCWTYWGQDEIDANLQTKLSSAFLNENVWISLKISLKIAPKVGINNISALVQIMAWRRPGDMLMASLTKHTYNERE